MKILSGGIVFGVFILTQVLLFTNLILFDNVFCYAYVGFLLLTPFEVSSIQKMMIGFGTGLTIDIFYDTLGIHAAACVFIMFIRPALEGIMGSKSDYSNGKKPTLDDMGAQWFIVNGLILIFIHHFLVFYIAAGFSDFFFNTGMKVVFSTFLSFIMFLIIERVLSRYIVLGNS